MAYARRTPGTSSKRGFTRKRSARVLQRAYRKKRSSRPRSSVAANAKAISRLKVADMGHLQVSYEVMTLEPTFLITKTQPLAFCLNDFTSYSQGAGGNSTGGSVYTPAYIGAAPNITLALTRPGAWEKRNPGFVEGLSSEYQQWKDQNENTLNLFGTSTDLALCTSYLPVYADYSFTFTRDLQASDTADIWLRFDEISPKKIYNQNIGALADRHIYNMPVCLGSFSNMANKHNPKTQNAYNPSLWHVKTRWVCLKAIPSSDGQLTKFVTHRMKMSFPKKELRLNPDRSIAGPQFQTFTELVDRRLHKWLIISVSNTTTAPATNTPLEMTFTRKITWRDSIGNRV